MGKYQFRKDNVGTNYLNTGGYRSEPFYSDNWYLSQNHVDYSTNDISNSHSSSIQVSRFSNALKRKTSSEFENSIRKLVLDFTLNFRVLANLSSSDLILR